jgi:MFS family permease
LLFGIDSFVPLFVLGTLGGSATRAGRTITPLFVAWSISVAIAAKVVIRLGYRGTALVGSTSIATGTALLALGSAYPAWSGGMFVAAMIVIGLGMGPTSLSYILAVQNAVTWERRGVATGAVAFFRTIGGALGVGVLGATLGWELGHRLLASGAAGIDVAAALRPETHARLGAGALGIVRGALGVSLRDVFLQMFALTVLGMICAARLPAGRAGGGRFGPSAVADRDADLLTTAAVEPWARQPRLISDRGVDLSAAVGQNCPCEPDEWAVGSGGFHPGGRRWPSISPAAVANSVTR